MKERTWKIIAVDFDGVLSKEDNWPNVGEMNKPLIRFLKEKQDGGDKIILWTCRSGQELRLAIAACAKEGLIFDVVNDNLKWAIDYFGGSNSRKVYADYYIDDHNVCSSDCRAYHDFLRIGKDN